MEPLGAMIIQQKANMIQTTGAEIKGDTLRAELWYPRHSPVKFIEIDLIDVRANDGLRLYFDFKRDGWVVQQASRWEWDFDEPIDYDWQEVAFIQGWGREKEAE